MGYSIPGADFTESDQLKVNVGTSLGASAANALSSFTKAWQANALQTKKLKQVKDDFIDQIVIANNATANQTIQAGLESGKFKKGTTIFEQWSKEVVNRGKLATQARIDMRFGDLDAEGKQKKLDVINSFTNYNKTSLQNMGRYTNDVLDYNNPENKQFITGDMSNGQYMNNIVTMTAANGVDAEKQFGKGATSERNLIVDGDNNIISSSVSIPKNNDFIKNMKTGSSAFNDVIATGLENGNIIDDGNGNYVFKSKINMSVYGTEGGPDFLVNHTEAVDQNALLNRANFLNKDNEILDTSYLGNNKEGFESYKITKNTGNNNLQTTELEVLDIGTLLGNDSFKTDMAAEVNTILRPGRSARAIASDIAHNYTTADIQSFYEAFPGLKKYKSFEEFYGSTDTDLKKSFTNNVIREHMFANIFKDQKIPGNKDGVSFITRELNATKDKELIEYLNNNNAKNSLGEAYKAGDMVYGREIIKSEKITKPASISYNEKVYNNLQKGVDESILFAALTVTPAKSKIMYTEKDGIKGTYVMQEGFPTGTALKPKALNLLFKP
jgi:hypothetical protein